MVGQSWVGGDITGLAAMGITMRSAPDQLSEVVKALSDKVDSLVGATGWSGDAASQFDRRWTTDSITAGSLAVMVDGVGAVLSDLADNLRAVEMTLYKAAYQAQQQGVPIGPDGRPPTLAASTPASPQVQARLDALQAYVVDYNVALHLAQGFRLNAASRLSAIYDQISYQPGRQNTPDQWVTIGDYLRGLYVIPDELNRTAVTRLPQQIEDLQDRMREARRALRQAKADYAAKGLKLPSNSPAALEHNQVASELRDLRSRLASAESGEGNLPFSRALNARLADIAREIPEFDRLTSGLPKFLDFVKEIPLVEGLAAGVATDLQAKDDMGKGWSPSRAWLADGGAGAAGFIAGLGTLAAIPAAPVEVPVAAVLVISGSVAAGIGDFVYQGFHEHWTEDIHHHGVVGGVLTGGGHMFKSTEKEMANMADNVGHAAHSLWHGLFG